MLTIKQAIDTTLDLIEDALSDRMDTACLSTYTLNETCDGYALNSEMSLGSGRRFELIVNFSPVDNITNVIIEGKRLSPDQFKEQLREVTW